VNVRRQRNSLILLFPFHPAFRIILLQFAFVAVYSTDCKVAYGYVIPGVRTRRE